MIVFGNEISFHSSVKDRNNVAPKFEINAVLYFVPILYMLEYYQILFRKCLVCSLMLYISLSLVRKEIITLSEKEVFLRFAMGIGGV